MKRNTRKHISIALAVVCCLSLVVGSFAFFTDRAEISGTANAGELAIGLAATDISDQLVGADNLDNWNPGDKANFTYTIENDASKALRAQETITLTVIGGTGERVITKDDVKLTIKTKDSGAALETVNAVAAEAVEGGYKLTYIMPEFDLSGSEEVLTGIDTTKAVTYSLDFDKSALNNYQDAQISINVHVDAIQYYNTTEDVAENEVYKYRTVEQELVITNANGVA